MKLEIEAEYLKELLDYESRSLVGKIMKRHEILGSTDNKLKAFEKELVYEEFRQLFSLIVAAGKGSYKKVFNFKSRG